MRRKRAESAGSFKVVAASVSFVGAILAALFGCVLTTRWLPGGTGHPWLYQLGTILLIIALPLLICGGHYLDLMERDAKKPDSKTS
ncbi:MAG: hypothetical protein ACREBG_17155 [Pyrinomonadaceae bacterium]